MLGDRMCEARARWLLYSERLDQPLTWSKTFRKAVQKLLDNWRTLAVADRQWGWHERDRHGQGYSRHRLHGQGS